MTVIDSNSHVLSTFDRAIAEYATAQISTRGVRMVLQSRVVGVGVDGVDVLDKGSNVVTRIPSATVVWATGVGLHPLCREVAAALPPGSQPNARALVVDERLVVRGSGGSIYALGDAATVESERALAHVEECGGGGGSRAAQGERGASAHPPSPTHAAGFPSTTWTTTGHSR